MTNLNGFQLELLCADKDSPCTDAVFEAETKALLQPLTLNDSGLSDWGASKGQQGRRRSLMIFVPMSQAASTRLWNGIIGWLQGEPGRALRMRVNGIGGDVHTIREILPILRNVLKELTEITSRSGISS